MRIVFFGSSDFSIPALEACLESSHDVSLVITTPDRPKGRGLKESPTPVRQFAEERNLPAAAPERPKSSGVILQLQERKPDLFVISSYGKMVPPAWLRIPSKARLNVHPSLLPKYRGAAPINWAILNGEKETGVSIMEITDELDAGDIFYQKAVPIDPESNAEELSRRLAALSRNALREVLEQIQRGELKGIAQNPSLSTYARKLQKSDGVIRWSRPAVEIHNQIRGLIPWPTASAKAKGESLQILESRLLDPEEVSGRPGELLGINRGGAVTIQAGKGTIAIETLRPAGRKTMSGAGYVNGRRLKQGFFFE